MKPASNPTPQEPAEPRRPELAEPELKGIKDLFFLDLIESPHELKFSNPAKDVLDRGVWIPLTSREAKKPTIPTMLHLKPDGRVMGAPLQPALARLHRLQAEEPEHFELAPFTFVPAKIESDGSLILSPLARKHLGLFPKPEKEPLLWLHVRPGYFEILPDPVHTQQSERAHKELGRISLSAD